MLSAKKPSTPLMVVILQPTSETTESQASLFGRASVEDPDSTSVTPCRLNNGVIGSPQNGMVSVNETSCSRYLHVTYPGRELNPSGNVDPGLCHLRKSTPGSGIRLLSCRCHPVRSRSVCSFYTRRRHAPANVDIQERTWSIARMGNACALSKRPKRLRGLLREKKRAA